MKRILIIFTLILTITLSGCDREEDANNMPDQVLFDNMVFEYYGDEDDFYIYESDGIEIEIKLEDDTMFVSYEKRTDIFFIEGTDETFTIRKNGSLVMSCSGEELTCTGTESVDFYEGVPSLYRMVYSEE